MASEADIENAVVRYAEQRRVFHTKLNVMLHRSMPDRVFWVDGGRPLLIEFKKPGKEPTKLQMLTLKKLEGLGYDVGWTSSKEEAIGWIEEAINVARTGKSDAPKAARLPVARLGASGHSRRRRHLR